MSCRCSSRRMAPRRPAPKPCGMPCWPLELPTSPSEWHPPCVSDHSLHSRVRTEIEDLHHRVLSQTYRAKSFRLLRSAKSSTETASDAYLAAALALCVNDVRRLKTRGGEVSTGADPQIFAAETTWREAWAFAVRGIQHRGGCEQILFGRGDPSELQRLLVETACLTDLSGVWTA